MAWSDEARAAALEIRRAHAKARADIRGGRGPKLVAFHLRGGYQLSRESMARLIKAERAGRSTGTTLRLLGRNSALSTFQRNADRASGAAPQDAGRAQQARRIDRYLKQRFIGPIRRR